MEINPGDQVQVRGKVLRHRLSEHLPIEMQSVDVQLPDGQHLSTNVRNLVQHSIVTPEAAKDDELAAQHERKLMQIAEMSLVAARKEAEQLRQEIQNRDELLDAHNAEVAKLQEQLKQKDHELQVAAQELATQRRKPLAGVNLKKK